MYFYNTDSTNKPNCYQSKPHENTHVHTQHTHYNNNLNDTLTMLFVLLSIYSTSKLMNLPVEAMAWYIA